MRSRITRTSATLAAGLALVAIAIAVTLSGSPVAVVRTNFIPPNQTLAEAAGDAGACQAGEELPRGATAIRLGLQSVIGPRVGVTALAGGHVLTSGVVGSGWAAGSVTIPVRPVARTTPDARICFRLGPTREKVGIEGEPTSAAIAVRTREGTALPGRMKIEYVRAGSSSWWSLASGVARRMGIGRAPAGTWIVLLLAALMGAVVATASWVTLRELR
jgi:hypothetical protein